ncbi:MAG: amidase [Vicinamibacterales bacterium]
MTRRAWLAALGGAVALPAWARQVPAPPSGDLTALGMAELSRRYAAGSVTPIEVTAAYLARIDREDPALGAFVTVSRRRAVDDTRRLLRGARAMPSPGRLMGVPVAHKDLFRTRGVRSAGGSRLYEHDVPAEDADTVARLAAAGAVMLGKTNTHELGGGVTTINPFFGTTRNPRDRTRIPGGSSGGSAAVAARLARRHGQRHRRQREDSRRAVRLRGPQADVRPRCPPPDCSRRLPDLRPRRTADAHRRGRRADARGHRAGARRHRPGRRRIPGRLSCGRQAGRTRSLRVGVARSYFGEDLEPGVAAAVERTLDGLRAAGARVVDVQVGVAVRTLRRDVRADCRERDPRHLRTGVGGAARRLLARLRDRVRRPRPHRGGRGHRREARDAVQRSMEAVLAELDVLVTPTVPVVAPPIDGPIDGMRILRNTWAFNAARVLALSVPCGTGADRLPVGLQIAGRRYSEAMLLAVATLVEQLDLDRPA